MGRACEAWLAWPDTDVIDTSLRQSPAARLQHNTPRRPRQPPAHWAAGRTSAQTAMHIDCRYTLWLLSLCPPRSTVFRPPPSHANLMIDASSRSRTWTIEPLPPRRKGGDPR
ncbi:hypothetical protein PSPO01_09429 [Paraphaeosphaeria sporulosa]